MSKVVSPRTPAVPANLKKGGDSGDEDVVHVTRGGVVSTVTPQKLIDDIAGVEGGAKDLGSRDCFDGDIPAPKQESNKESASDGSFDSDIPPPKKKVLSSVKKTVVAVLPRRSAHPPVLRLVHLTVHPFVLLR